MNRKHRVAVQQETVEMVKQRDDLREGTQFTKYKATSFDELVPKFKKPVKIFIEQGDTLETVVKYQTLLDRRFCFLIMANAFYPGGGWEGGSAAQEESVCRRSNVFLAFNQIEYPLDEFGGVYGKNVKIFRRPEDQGCRVMDTVHSSDCVFVAGYSNPKLENGKMTTEMIGKTRLKIKAMLDQCIKMGNRDLVLGALGCGSFCNPPEQIAQLFRRVLNSDRYRHQFDTVVFAIYDNEYSNNCEIFRQVFAKN